jgi:hypothetical protein
MDILLCGWDTKPVHHIRGCPFPQPLQELLEPDRPDGQEDSMKRRRHTPEQIIRKLREADRLLAEGHEIPEVAKQLEISEATYHRWRAQYGGLKADDVKRLKELESENAWLKRIVADKELQIEALKELGRGNW